MMQEKLEYWDVVEQIPPTSANNNTMFYLNNEDVSFFKLYYYVFNINLVAKSFSGIQYTSNNDSKGISWDTSLLTLLSLFQLVCVRERERDND
jgi:hypothetical protein